jgi:hypothetical protein
MIANLFGCFSIGVLVHADFDDSSGFRQIEVMAGLVLVEAIAKEPRFFGSAS